MWSFGAPSLTKNGVYLMVAVYASVFYESLGASLALLSFFIACSTSFDILNDPIIANLTD
jgi:Na+/melibiose symporter-like transporter